MQCKKATKNRMCGVNAKLGVLVRKNKCAQNKNKTDNENTIYLERT